jgi:hypothetical protein
MHSATELRFETCLFQGAPLKAVGYFKNSNIIKN